MNQHTELRPGAGQRRRRGTTITLDDSLTAHRHRTRPNVDRGLPVQHVPPLAGHRGPPPDLILDWNVASVPKVIDIVVHLHGYWYPRINLARDIRPVSGLDLAPVAGSTGSRRSRPTLTILPRGHDTGVKQRWRQKDGTYKYGYNKFTFPALVTRDGLADLIRFSLDRFAGTIGGATPAVGRLILTAHSGGGAALLQILQFCDPHQVHVFDGLYQDARALAGWARRRIRRDRVALDASDPRRAADYMSSQGGALRVFYAAGTRYYSRALYAAISTELGRSLRPWYRVEASKYDHFRIPARYGWRVLADASADVPDAYTEPVMRSMAHPAHSHEAELAEVPGATVTFPNGAALRVVPGQTGTGQDHFDPHQTGNPLLDTSESVRRTLLSANFTVGELARSGGQHFDQARIDPELVRCLQHLRDQVGKPVHVQSGYRSYAYNVRLYRERYHKTPTESRHSSGQAADIEIAGMSGMQIAKAAIDLCGPNIGVGIANTYTHIDVRRTWARWTYFGRDTERDRLAIAEIDAYRRRRVESGRPSPPSPAPAPTLSPAATARIGDALARGLWDSAVRIAIGTGITGVNQLTDLLLYLRHPQPHGTRIRPDQRDRAREWIEIRDRWVKPALARR